MKSPFGRIEDLFNTLNDAGIKYLVLRNYENLLEPELYVDGHGDIDMLCSDSQETVDLINAQALTQDKPGMRGDGVHYAIEVDGKPVKLDLRHLGDGYYCTKWEKEMLERRVGHDCFYVMNETDYFYSLIYHAVLQKRSFSQEYSSRLFQMSKGLGLVMTSANEHEYLLLLQEYMRDHGYRFTYSKDHLVPNRFHLVDQGLIDKDCGLKWKHSLYDMKIGMIEWLVKAKHALLH